MPVYVFVCLCVCVCVCVCAEAVAEWEKELQQELQDYEMVGGAGDLDDADLEREILQQIEQETEALS